MTEPAPELQPIADAFAAAGMVPAPAEPSTDDTRAEEAERAADVASIKRAFRKGRLKGALAVGKALGWSKADIEAIFTAPPSPSSGGGGGAPAGGDLDLPPAGGSDGRPRGRDPAKRPVKPLPDDCPVVPLGTMGGVCHYLDPHGQHVALAKHGPEDIRSLFSSRVDWLWTFHPKWKAGHGDGPPVLYSWETAYTAESLVEACGKRGIFDPGRRLRGVGAWRADDGGLVLHCGDAVLFVPASAAGPGPGGGRALEWRPPGYHGEHVYPGADKLPRPADEPCGEGPALELLTILSSWRFDGGGSDAVPTVSVHGREIAAEPIVILGWIVSALFGGALTWRTHLVLTGSEGTGKSTMQRLVGLLMGPYLVQATDATAAGVYQTVGYSSRAAAIDEAENDPSSLKMKNMVELVRNSASGGGILRGSNDAKVKSFESRTSFFLSAIFLPPFSGQDLTRIAKVELAPLDRNTPPPALDAGKIGALGRALRRRVVDGWPRWEETFARYRHGLAALGHDTRGCDQWGSLLAAADLALFKGLPDADTVDGLVGLVGRQGLEARKGEATTAQGLVDFLRTLPIEAHRGCRQMIGDLARGACGGGAEALGSAISCQDALRAVGIYVKPADLPGAGGSRVIVPNTHSGLAQLLERTPYATRPGAASSGWSQAMRRLRGAEPVNSRAYGGRGWSVPLDVFLGDDRVPA